MLDDSLGHSSAGVWEMDGAHAALNYHTVLARVDGNSALLRELADMFVADAPQWMAEIHRAVVQKNVPRLKSVVHLLRGSLGIFGPSAAYEAARQLETQADSGCLAGAEQICAALEAALHSLQCAVAQLVQGVPGECVLHPGADPFFHALSRIPSVMALPGVIRREDCC